MWSCPVCNTKNTTRLCRECSYDCTMDYERFPTLVTVSGKAISVRRAQYTTSKRPYIKCGNCFCTLFRIDPERFEMQCDQCGKIQPLPVKSVPVEKQITPQAGMQPAKASTSVLRFDGLYQSPDRKFNYWLRFFADGFVVGVTTDGNTDGSAANVSNWLKHSYNNSGQYKLQGNQISFSLKSSCGVVDYNGIVTKRGLELNSHSHINGNCSARNYSFVQV